jgi:hypothetical protein
MISFYGHTQEDIDRFFPGVQVTEKVLQQASVSALNKSVVSVRAALVDAIFTEYNLKKKDIRAELNVRRADAKSLEAEIYGSGSPGVPLYGFSPTPKRSPSTRRLKSGAYSPKTGISVAVKRGSRKKIAGAFIATMKSGHVGVFKRRERGTGNWWNAFDKKQSISELYGPSPIKLASQDKYQTMLDDIAEDLMDKNFAHEAEFYMKKAGLL